MGAARAPRDFYETPEACALAICKHLAESTLVVPERIIEPSAGSGAFVKAARATWPAAVILAVDIQAGNEQKLHKAGATSVATGDWLVQAPGAILQPDLIIGNPPFSAAEDHLAHALSFGPGTIVAFLLPLTFLASRRRATRFWQPQGHGVGGLHHTSALVPRPSFTANGQTDITEYGFYTFKAGNKGPSYLYPPIIWREAR